MGRLRRPAAVIVALWLALSVAMAIVMRRPTLASAGDPAQRRGQRSACRSEGDAVAEIADMPPLPARVDAHDDDIDGWLRHAHRSTDVGQRVQAAGG